MLSLLYFNEALNILFKKKVHHYQEKSTRDRLYSKTISRILDTGNYRDAGQCDLQRCRPDIYWE